MRRSPRRSLLVALSFVLLGLLSLPTGASAHPRYHGSFYVGFGFYGVPYYPYWGGYGWYPYPWGPYPPYYPHGWDTGSDIRIQATPREAQVYVDGYFVGIVDDFDGFSQRLRLQPGEYEVTLYLPGYRSVRERMLVRPRTNYKLRHTLQPLDQGEPNEPQPSPTPGATRSLPPAGPDRYGRPPTPRPPMPARERGAPAEGPIRQSGFGTLTVKVQPSGAVVIVDGERWDSPDGSQISVDLRAGTYQLEVQREGHKAYSKWVEIQDGQTTTLNVSLPKE